jgi:hypothetical protein
MAYGPEAITGVDVTLPPSVEDLEKVDFKP